RAGGGGHLAGGAALRPRRRRALPRMSVMDREFRARWVMPFSMFVGTFAWSFVYVSLPFYIHRLSTLDGVDPGHQPAHHGGDRAHLGAAGGTRRSQGLLHARAAPAGDRLRADGH